MGPREAGFKCSAAIDEAIGCLSMARAENVQPNILIARIKLAQAWLDGALDAAKVGDKEGP
jgi:hypothetical protein